MGFQPELMTALHSDVYDAFRMFYLLDAVFEKTAVSQV